jgi:hypothetical protein
MSTPALRVPGHEFPVHIARGERAPRVFAAWPARARAWRDGSWTKSQLRSGPFQHRDFDVQLITLRASLIPSRRWRVRPLPPTPASLGMDTGMARWHCLHPATAQLRVLPIFTAMIECEIALSIITCMGDLKSSAHLDGRWQRSAAPARTGLEASLTVSRFAGRHQTVEGSRPLSIDTSPPPDQKSGF